MTLQILFGTTTVLLALFLLGYHLRQRRYVKQLTSQLAMQNQTLEANTLINVQRQEEINQLQTKLRHTFEDPVTHLLSWELFQDRLLHNFSESERHQFILGLMYVDIDDFKMINDALSYDIGNKVLEEVGIRLRQCIRKVDSITRFSKDTFIILLTQLSKPETAAIVAQRILQALKEPFTIDGNEFTLTVDIGIATFPADAKDASTLLINAEQALRLAKKKGTHLYQFYKEEFHAYSQRELAMNVSLNRQQLFQEFVVHYQPIFDLRQNAVFAMDAQLQWKHPKLGLIHSTELFNYAKRQHKLNQITEWFLATAIKQFIQWQKSGLTPVCLGLPVWINQLGNSQFIYRVTQILQEFSFKPVCLILEIKQSDEHVPLEQLQKTFNMLKYIGVKIAIDEFGAETYAMQYLRYTQIDYLKLSPALIKDMETNEHTIALIKSILYLGQNLSTEIIANGVETKQQAQMLKDLGCHLIQGDITGSPLSAAEVIDKMTTLMNK